MKTQSASQGLPEGELPPVILANQLLAGLFSEQSLLLGCPGKSTLLDEIDEVLKLESKIVASGSKLIEVESRSEEGFHLAQGNSELVVERSDMIPVAQGDLNFAHDGH